MASVLCILRLLFTLQRQLRKLAQNPEEFEGFNPAGPGNEDTHAAELTGADSADGADVSNGAHDEVGTGCSPEDTPRRVKHVGKATAASNTPLFWYTRIEDVPDASDRSVFRLVHSWLAVLETQNKLQILWTDVVFERSSFSSCVFRSLCWPVVGNTVSTARQVEEQSN